jgi:hypothetical protein
MFAEMIEKPGAVDILVNVGIPMGDQFYPCLIGASLWQKYLARSEAQPR